MTRARSDQALEADEPIDLGGGAARRAAVGVPLRAVHGRIDAWFGRDEEGAAGGARSLTVPAQ